MKLPFLIILFTLIFHSTLLFSQNPNFGNPEVFKTTQYLNFKGYVAKDIDSNGYMDFVIGHGREVGVLFGNANGTYSNIWAFSIGNNMNGITSGDFNNDGQYELAIVAGINALYINYVGFGSGSVPGMTQHSFTTGKDPKYVVSADINNDHYDDVIVSNYSDTSIYVFTNTKGSFTSNRYKVGNNPKMLSIADFNHDGYADICGINEGDNNIFALINKGNGLYQNSTSYTIGASPNYIISTDINNDFYPEIIVSSLTSNTIIVLGNNNGSFSTTQTYNTGSLPYSINSVDLNNDNYKDIVIPNYGSSDISVYLGSANGSLSFKENFKTELHPSTLASADFNNDNKSDIISGNIGNGNFTLLTGDGSGNLSIACTYAVDKGNGQIPWAVIPYDFNQDQLIDVVAFNDDNISMIKANGSGKFNSSINRTTYMLSVEQADFNEDGNLDLVGPGVRNLSVLLGKGNGEFDTLITNRNYIDGGDIISGYFNNDSHLDIAITTSTGYISSPNAKVSIYLGDGTGKFDSLTTFYTTGGSIKVLSQDFDTDGISDIAVAAYYDYGNTFEVFKGLGNGFFQKTQSTYLGVLHDIKSADLNNDKILDLFAVGSSGGYLLSGTGLCTFNKVQKLYGNIQNITLDDYNNDGNIDYVITSAYSTSFSIALGDGKGGLISDSYKAFNNSDYFYPTISADFNNDGLKDIVTSKDNIFNIYLGKGDGDFYTPLKFSSINTSGAWIASDYNKDNKMDIIEIGTAGSGRCLSLLLNTGQFTGSISYPTSLITSIQSNSIKLTWTDNSNNESKFVIERSSTNAYSGFTALASLISNSISYIDSSAALGTTYYYKVRAVDSNFSSGYSNVADGMIPKINQTISFDSLPIVTYGDSDLTMTASATSSLPITYTSNDPAIAKISGSSILILGAGTCIITATQLGNSTYNAAASIQQTLTIHKAVLTVKADDKTRNYGVSNPILTYFISGFKNTDNTDVVNGQPTITTSAIINSPANIYDIIITQGSLNAINYTFSFINGILTVNDVLSPILVVKKDSIVISNNGTYNFGDVNQGSNKNTTFNITNIGNTDLNISSISSNNPEFEVDISVTRNIIQKDSTSSFTVSFNPQSAGISDSEIDIISDDQNGVYKLQLSGNGLTLTSNTNAVAINNNLKIYPIPLIGSEGFIVESSNPIKEIILINSVGEKESYKSNFIKTEMKGIILIQAYTESEVQFKKVYIE